MEAGACAFTDGIKTVDRGACVCIDDDSAAEIVSGGGDGNHVAGYVNSEGETFFVDIREMATSFFGVFVSNVEENVVGTVEFHFRVDRAGHDIPGGEGKAGVIFMHEFLAVEVTEDSTISTHSFSNEERGAVAGVIKCGWMELYELHVADCSLSPIDHSDSVAGCYEGVGGCSIDGADSACGHHCCAAEESFDFAGLFVEDIGSVASDIRGSAGNDPAEMMLSNDLDGEVVFEYMYIRMIAEGTNKSLLDFSARVIGMV